MRLLACHNLSLAVVFLTLLASFNERYLVVPPHYIGPIGFVVFLEVFVKLEVFSDLHHDIIWSNSWVVW